MISGRLQQKEISAQKEVIAKIIHAEHCGHILEAINGKTKN